MATVQEAVRRLSIESTSKGVTETVDKLKQLRQAHGGVTVESQKSEKATISLERRLNSIQRQYDRNYRAEQAMVKIERDLNAAQAQGLITAARKNELLGLAAARHSQAAAATGVHARALAGLNVASATAASFLTRLMLPLAAAGGTILSGRAFVTNTVEQERAQAQLEAVVRSTGGAAGYAGAELARMATGLQKVTTFGDEAVMTAQGLLLTFTRIGREVFPDALQSILDVSIAMDQGLKESTVQIGKALNDPIKGLTALQRVGIQFTASQKEQIKTMVEAGRVADAQRVILAELQVQFGGSAAAARDTLGGALAGLQNAFGDLFEVSGEGSRNLTDSINRLTDTLSDPAVMSAIQNFGAGLFDAFSGAINQARILSFAIKSIGEGNIADAFGILFGPGFREGAGQRYFERQLKAGTAGSESAATAGAATNDFYDAFGGTFRSPAATRRAPPAGGQTDEQIRDAERAQKQIDKVIEALAHEEAQLGRTAREQDIFNRLQAAGVDITSEYGMKIAEAAGQLYDLKDAQTSAREASTFFAKTAYDGIRSLIPQIDTGVAAVDRLTNALLDAGLQAALLGEGPLAGLFGTKSTTGGAGGILGSIFAQALAGGAGSGVPRPGVNPFFSANGNAFDHGNVIPFRRGGVVDRPSIFPMANGGIGMMAEDEPEAVMPLRRGRDGRLGVEAAGGGIHVEVVNEIVNNNGSEVRTERRRDGNREINRIIIGSVQTGAARGDLDSVLGGRMGARTRVSRTN